jgi:hypothetical protein
MMRILYDVSGKCWHPTSVSCEQDSESLRGHLQFDRTLSLSTYVHRFSPAEIDGRKVKQLVLMPFDFNAP